MYFAYTYVVSFILLVMVCLDDSVLPYLPFTYQRQQIRHQLDGVSERIYIPNGFLFGTQTHTLAYVRYIIIIIFTYVYYA